uniref:Phospholipase B-like n=1 Tax=Entamoeba invadens TaxID=33085 RepID=S0B136_ENTIV|nr:hypothetical protein, conserved [Entamoeba invadens]
MFVLLSFVAICMAAKQRTISVYHTDDKWTISRVNDPEAVAVASYKYTRNEQGYTELRITTNKKYSDKEQMFATGFADGYFSAYDINNHQSNMDTWYIGHYLDNKPYPKSLYNYIQSNIDYINKKIEDNAGDAYWTSVDLVMEQVRGITAGHNLAVSLDKQMTFFDMFFYESYGDLLDLTAVLPGDDGVVREMWYKKYANDSNAFHLQWKMRTKCSGLVKYVKDKHDIYVSQAAWFYYGAMTRVMKYFNIQLSSDYLSAKEVSFSSYPGFVFSFDDFYMTSNNLAIFETTFPNFNTDLNKFIVPETILDWLRIVVAVRHSDNGDDFFESFKKENSGTYNNQWIVVDYDLLNSVEDGIPEKTFTVSEQLPGYMYFQDFSKSLEETGYFGSYNLPAIQETIDMSNLMEHAQTPKDKFWNSPTGCCRANIFRANAPAVNDMDAMKKMMKYNKWQDDINSVTPDGIKDSGAAIGARYDLRDQAIGALPFGQMDAKICEKAGFDKLRFHVEAGPTHDDQEVLDFNTFPSHNWNWGTDGVVKVWNFEWEEFVPK